MQPLRPVSHVVLGFALAAALTAPFAADAQAPASAPPRIAVIDTERILLTSETGKRALADLKRLQEAKENEARTLQQELKDLQAQMQAGQASLTQEKLAELKGQIDSKMIALRRFQDDANRDLGKKRDEVLAAVDAKVMPVINHLGKELGYGLIFRKFESGLIYADDALDITSVAIQRLDAAAP